MQSNLVSNLAYGEGIYEESGVEESRIARDNDDVSLRAGQIPSLYDVNHNLRESEQVGEESETELALSEPRVDDILEVLDRQTETLNGLRKTANNFNQQSSSPATKKGDELEAIDAIYEKLFTRNTCGKPDDESEVSNRRARLEQYVRNVISDDGNCSCHFHLGSNELNLLNELNECYRKSCRFNCDDLNKKARRQIDEQQQQQVTKEALSSSGCEGSSAARNTDCINQSRFSSLSQSDDEHEGHEQFQQLGPRDLFIDSQSLHSLEGRSSATGCHLRLGQSAFSKSESELCQRADRECAPRFSRLREFGLNKPSSRQQLLEQPQDEPLDFVASFSERPSWDRTQAERLLQDGFWESSPECEQASALVSVVEESPDRDLGFVRSSEFKRKGSSCYGLSTKRLKRSSSSSLATGPTNQSNDSCLELQLGCSLTNNSEDSQSPPDHSSNYPCDSFEELDLTESNYSPDSDELSPESSDRYRVSVGCQAKNSGPTRRANPLFSPASNYNSIGSCSSFEFERIKACSADLPRLARGRRSLSSSNLHWHAASNDYVALRALLPSDESPQRAPSQLEGPTKSENYASTRSQMATANGPHRAAEVSPRPRAGNQDYDEQRRDNESFISSTEGRNGFDCLNDATSEAKTQQQQKQGFATEHELRQRQGSASNCLTENSGTSSKGNDAAASSMKAAKDIAKLSIPSLASLQYLPGQLDVRGGRAVDRSAGPNKKPVSNDRMAARASQRVEGEVRRSNSMRRHIDTPATRTSTLSSCASGQQSESESTKHNDSCLFHRWCLCNCMARSQHNNNVKKVKNAQVDDNGELREALSSPTGSSKSSSSRSRKSPARHGGRENVAGSSVSPSASGRASIMSDSSCEVNLADSTPRAERDSQAAGRDVTSRVGAKSSETPSRAAMPLRGGAGEDGPEVRKEVRADSTQGKMELDNEKQSPSYMNLLKPSQIANKRAQAGAKVAKYEGGPQRAVARQHVKGTPTKSYGSARAPTNSDGLGSIGDLAASGRSSATSDSCTSEFSTPALEMSASSKISSKGGRIAESSSDGNSRSDSAGSNQLPAGTKQALSCSHHSQSAEKSKRVPAYKRFLSPRKLFTSSSLSVCDCDENSLGQQQASFLSRSLSRLSGRQKRISSSSSEQQVTTTGSAQEPTSSFRGRTESASSNSQADTTYSDSINLPSEICHSLPYSINHEVLGREYRHAGATRFKRAPDIVLSRVEYQDVGSTGSCDLTRSLDGSHQDSCRPGSAQSERILYNRPIGHQPHRHGSELSFSSASDASGPFSSPSSPHSRRRLRSKSPRLSSSPVSFYSPVIESTKIEDGLKVCSTEHFEKHIGNIKENQIEAQKRLFTVWINHYAPNLIRHDLFVELQDGIKLIGLLAILTHDNDLYSQYKRLSRDNQTYINRLSLTPSSRLKNLSNVSIAIDYLRKKLGMKLVNLNPMDIVSGKANVILGLCWSIILNFQFQKGFLKDLDSLSDHSSSIASEGTSRFSDNRRNEDGARNYSKQVEEFTAKDIANARKRILDHINKRFNLKLTNLTSNLMDSDVLLAIIRHLLPADIKLDLGGPVYKSEKWDALSDDEKLDYVFQLAQDYLNVPRLMSAADLRQQTIVENNSKPLLVYLSMLLKANPRDCSTDQMLELRQLDESLKKRFVEDKQVTSSGTSTSEENINSKIANKLANVDTADKFHIDKLKSTLTQIKDIAKIMAGRDPKQSAKTEIDRELVERQAELKREAEQVESVIEWINRADKLFERTPSSSRDLARTIDEYRKFFSPNNLPKVDTTLPRTLERQYRECLAIAKQRVLTMEQTMKNWLSYEQANQKLQSWFAAAEAKLCEIQRPHTSQNNSQKPCDRPDPVELHMSRFNDLVEFFELGPIDVNDFDEQILPARSADGSSACSLSIDQSNRSLSSSINSLDSMGSRLSNLTNSRRATYSRLFDEYELKCRLLVAVLDPMQRDELLLTAKEQKSKLKNIIEYKVPQVIDEIRRVLNRCEMSIKEQDESVSDPEDQSQALSELVSSPEVTASPTSTDIASDDATTSASVGGRVVANGRSGKQTSGSGSSKAAQKRKGEKLKSSTGRGSKSNRSRKSKGNNPVVKTAIRLTEGKWIDDDDEKSPFVKRLWNRIKRASKISLSFNILLLICLAGICVVPLIQKDACCELSQAPIPSDKFTVNQKPT